MFVSSRRNFGKPAQAIDQEPGQPDALSLALDAHAVHAVVPVAAAHQGKAVRAQPQPVLQSAEAVIVKRAGFLGDLRHAELIILTGLQHWSFEVRHLLVKDR